MAESYAFSRGILASVRLYLQHWMWRYQLGFLLHPKIETKGSSLKVADIACGTGVWLIETARTLPEAQLDGYDISSSQFPAKERLPKNVKLATLDALGLIPEDLVGKYDVIHISLFVMLVRDENPAPVLENLMLMLKPGGFLQWEESDIDSLHASLAERDISESCDEELVSKVLTWFAARGLTSQWIGKMDELFSQHGLNVLDFQRLPIDNVLAKPWTDMQIMALEDVMENFILPAAGSNYSKNSPTAEEWRDMLGLVVQKCQKGMSITMDMVFAAGQKRNS